MTEYEAMVQNEESHGGEVVTKPSAFLKANVEANHRYVFCNLSMSSCSSILTEQSFVEALNIGVILKGQLYLNTCHEVI